MDMNVVWIEHDECQRYAQFGQTRGIFVSTRILATLRQLNNREINKQIALERLDGALLAEHDKNPCDNTFETLVSLTLNLFLHGDLSRREAADKLMLQANQEQRQWLTLRS